MVTLSTFSQQLSDPSANCSWKTTKEQGGIGSEELSFPTLSLKKEQATLNLFSRCSDLDLSLLFLCQHFPSLPCPFMVRCKFERGMLDFLWENAVMHICSKWCPASWVRCFRKAVQLSPWKKAVSPCWEAFATQCCHLPLPQRARTRPLLLTGLPPSSSCYHILLTSSSNSLLNSISSRRAYLAVASNRRQSCLRTSSSGLGIAASRRAAIKPG